MKRQDWPELLDAYLIEVANRAFTWGEHDCCSMASEWVRRCSGVSIELPAYTTAKEALRIIAAGGGLQAMITERLGQPADEPQRGDVALLAGGAVGIVLGEVVAGPGADGYALVPRGEIIAAWRL